MACRDYTGAATTIMPASRVRCPRWLLILILHTVKGTMPTERGLHGHSCQGLSCPAGSSFAPGLPPDPLCRTMASFPPCEPSLYPRKCGDPSRVLVGPVWQKLQVPPVCLVALHLAHDALGPEAGSEAQKRASLSTVGQEDGELGTETRGNREVNPEATSLAHPSSGS